MIDARLAISLTGRDFLGQLVKSLSDNPHIVTDSRDKLHTLHLASPRPNMLTLCAKEYDSLVSATRGAGITICKACAQLYSARMQ